MSHESGASNNIPNGILKRLDVLAGDIASFREHVDRRFATIETDVQLLRQHLRQLNARASLLEDDALARPTPPPESVR